MGSLHPSCHLANKIENKLINDLIPSPALFSAFLLWGPSKNLEENIKQLNNLMNRKNLMLKIL